MSAAEPHPRRRVALWRALSIAVLATLGVAGPPAPGAAAQTLPTSTTALTTTTEEEPAETTSTERDLLVSGDGTEGAESTTTTSTTVGEVAAEDGVLDEQDQIWLIVAGLVLVALLIGVWTWRYWVRTRPTPVEQ